MIKLSEIKKMLSMIVLSIGSFYLVFPLRSLIDRMFFNEALQNHVLGDIFIGIVILIVGGILFDWD